MNLLAENLFQSGSEINLAGYPRIPSPAIRVQYSQNNLVKEEIPETAQTQLLFVLEE